MMILSELHDLLACFIDANDVLFWSKREILFLTYMDHKW
jgi:hypothetical protein